MLTAKARYGLKAMAHLAALEHDETATAADIAAAETIPRKFLEAILAMLRDAGLVIVRRGPAGGYRLARSAGAITIGEVIDVFDRRLTSIACAGRGRRDACAECADVRCCRLRPAMVKVRDAIAGVLDDMTLADMLVRAPSASGSAAKPRVVAAHRH